MINKGALMQIFIYQALNVLCYDRYTETQLSKPILKCFLIFLLKNICKVIKYDGSQLLAGRILSTSKILRETKEKEKDAGRVLDRENMADVLEQRHPVCRVFVTD